MTEAEKQKYNKSYYIKHREELRNSQRKYRKEHKDEIYNRQAKWRKEIRDAVFKHYGKKCKCCGISYSEFLGIDHRWRYST